MIMKNSKTILEIETRGKKNSKNIYFKVNDVVTAFDIPNLYTTLTNKNTCYEPDIHYVYFNCENVKKTTVVPSKITNSTNQMGTIEQKKSMFSKISGVPVDYVVEILDTNVNKIPALYLMTLGFVKDLRAEMNIDRKYDDSMIVCIYGRTDSITRRSNEHNNGYENLESAEAYVDPLMLSKAETEVSNYVTSTNCRFLHETETEMFIVDEKQLKLFETQYENIAKKYMGNKAEIIYQLKDKDNEINNLQLDYEKKIIETQQETREKYSDLLDKLHDKNESLEKKLNDEYRNNLNLEKKHCVEI